MNHDRAFTISDVWLSLKSIFFVPGDAAVASFGPTSLGHFLEVSPSSFGGDGSFAISVVVWLIAIPFVISAVEDVQQSAALRERMRR